ncbi:MAG: prepilin peptidase [Clostridiaceae bacterium]|nr:prepilin peptidase [Clostridiaceae bacterium]
MQIYTLIIFFIFGTVFGSFFNVVGLRLPEKSLFREQRSYCDSCHKQLGWRELIPIWSFVAQKGRCRECGGKISPLYPLIELVTGLLAAFTYYRYAWSRELLLGLLLIALIMPVTVADISSRKVPNQLLLFFSPVFIIYRGFCPLTPWWDSLLGAGTALVLLLLIFYLSHGGMGMGDVKYYTLFGFIFGLEQFFLLFLLSTVYGVIIGIIKMRVKGTGRRTKLAFAPFIGLAALTVFYFGPAIIQWYKQLF